MQVSIVDNGGVDRTISFVLNKTTVEKQYNNFFAAARKNYPVKGFRPGTAPDNVLRVKLGDAAKTEVAGRLVQEALVEAVRPVLRFGTPRLWRGLNSGGFLLVEELLVLG